MASAGRYLVQREFLSLKKKPRSNYFQVYSLLEENALEWIVYIIGPPQTIYAGGVFRAVMRFPESFPMDPPSIQFTSALYHPNVYRDGKVCISTLQTPPSDLPPGRSTEFWRPVLGVEQALLSVVSLLSDPNCDDPANLSAAKEWRCDQQSFKQKVAMAVEKSKREVPEDFVFPVVVSASDNFGNNQNSSDVQNTNWCESGTLDELDHENEEYIYSDDDYDESELREEEENNKRQSQEEPGVQEDGDSQENNTASNKTDMMTPETNHCDGGEEAEEEGERDDVKRVKRFVNPSTRSPTDTGGGMNHVINLAYDNVQTPQQTHITSSTTAQKRKRDIDIDSKPLQRTKH